MSSGQGSQYPGLLRTSLGLSLKVLHLGKPQSQANQRGWSPYDTNETKKHKGDQPLIVKGWQYAQKWHGRVR